MYSGKWTAGLKAEEKQLMQDLLANNNKVLDKLSEICYNSIRDTESVSSNYDNPNWALRQADLIGYRRAMENIIKLCTPVKERDPVRK